MGTWHRGAEGHVIAHPARRADQHPRGPTVRGGSIEGVLEDPADVLLMTSELVANVVRHTESQVTVTVRPGPPVRVEVHDGIAATDTFRRLVSTAGRMPEASSPGGRGLALVRELASKIGLDDDPDGGKVVWFEL
jgi:anti-sigma regulatory factor (Ser/Thr protein kinase)